MGLKVKATLRKVVRSTAKQPTQEQDKSSEIEWKPTFGDRKDSNTQPQNKGGGGKQTVTSLTKYEVNQHLWIITTLQVSSPSIFNF